MTKQHRWHRFGLALVVLIASSLLATSCSKKDPVGVDPNDGLEGIPSESQLIVWRDTPLEDSTFADLGPPGPSPEDTLVTTSKIYYSSPGEALGMIFDYTAANRFELFRRESGAFRWLKDFNVYPSKRFFKGHADVFRFLDVPLSASSQDYVARGIVDGMGDASAPKTNIGRVGSLDVAGDLHYTGPTGIAPDFRPLDSLVTMSWDPYAGAAGYWIHIYQLTNQGGEDIVRSGLPAPVFVGVTRDYLIMYVPGNVTAYRVGDPVPAGGRILTSTPMIASLQYQVRVSAVGADGQLIAYTGTSGSFAIFRGETTYRKFPQGSVTVEPHRGGPVPADPMLGIPTSNPRLSILPARTTPGR